MSSSVAMRSTSATKPTVTGRRGRAARVVTKASQQEPEIARAPMLGAAAAAVALALGAASPDFMHLVPAAQANEAVLNKLSGSAKGAGANLKGAVEGASSQAAGAVKGAANKASGSASGASNKLAGVLSKPTLTLPFPGAGISEDKVPLPNGGINADKLGELGGQAKANFAEASGGAKGATADAQGSAKGAVEEAKGSASGLLEKVKGALPLSTLPNATTAPTGERLANKAEEAVSNTRDNIQDTGDRAANALKSAGAKINQNTGASEVAGKIKNALPISTLPSASDIQAKGKSNDLTGQAKGAAAEATGNLKGSNNEVAGAAKGAAAEAKGAASGLVDKVKGALSNSPISTLPSASDIQAKAKDNASGAKNTLPGSNNDAAGAVKGAAAEAKGNAGGLVDKVKSALSNSPISTLPGPGGYNNTLSDNVKSTIGDVSREIRGDQAKSSSFVKDRRNEPNQPSGQNLAANAQDAVKPSAAEQVTGFLKNVPISSMPNSNPMAQELNKVKGYGDDAKQAVKSALGPIPGGNPGANAGNESAKAAKDAAGNAQSASQNIIDSAKTVFGAKPLVSQTLPAPFMTLPGPLAAIPDNNPMAQELNKVKGYGDDAKQAVKSALGPIPGGNPGANAGNESAKAAKDAAGNAQSASQNIIDSAKTAFGAKPLVSQTLPAPFMTLPGPLAAIPDNNPMAQELNKVKGYGDDAKQAVKSALGPIPGGNPGANAGNESAKAAKDAAGNAQSASQNIIDSAKTAFGAKPLVSQTLPAPFMTLPGPLAAIPDGNPMSQELNKVKGYGNDAKQAVKNTLGAAPGGNPGVNVGNPAAGAAKDAAAGANSATQNVIDSVKTALGAKPLVSQTLPMPLAIIGTNESARNAEAASQTYNPPLAKDGDVDYTKKVADSLKQIPRNAQAAASEAREKAADALPGN